MRLSVIGIRIVGAVVLALLSAGPASAQRATGPFSGLFGGDHDSSRVQGGTTQTLDLSGSLFGAYNDILDTPPVLTPGVPLDPGVQTSGTSTGGTGNLSYSRRGDRLQFLLNGGSAVEEYSSSPDFLATSYNARTGLAANLGPKLSMNVGAGAAYSPFYAVAPFQDASTPFTLLTPGFDLSTVAQRNVAFDESVGLTDTYSRRSSLSLSFTGRQTRLLDSSSNDVTMWGGSASYQHRFTRALGFHVGYGENEVRYAFTDAAPINTQTIDAGVDYGSALAFSRRTTLSFSTSTSALRLNGQTHYLLNGAATLSHGFKRSWSASIGYVRGVNYQPGFSVPLISDSVSAGLGGQLATRVKWSSGAGASRGVIGFSGAGSLITYSATSSLNVAVTRKLGLYTQYSYYRYQAPVGSNDLILLAQFARQAVSAGLSIWVPILNPRGGSR
jgi:hypothetical protein